MTAGAFFTSARPKRNKVYLKKKKMKCFLEEEGEDGRMADKREKRKIHRNVEELDALYRAT